MNKIICRGYRFPPEIIQRAIWLYYRFTLSLRDVEELLAELGIDVYDATKSPIAEEALRRIQEFYVIEAEITGKPANVRLAERQARAVPLLAAFKTWAEGERRRLSTKTKLGKALQYSLSRWDALIRYTTD